MDNGNTPPKPALKQAIDTALAVIAVIVGCFFYIAKLHFPAPGAALLYIMLFCSIALFFTWWAVRALENVPQNKVDTIKILTLSMMIIGVMVFVDDSGLRHALSYYLQAPRGSILMLGGDILFVASWAALVFYIGKTYRQVEKEQGIYKEGTSVKEQIDIYKQAERERLKKRWKRMRYWLIPFLALIAFSYMHHK